eukprot:Rmarinus@m.535
MQLKQLFVSSLAIAGVSAFASDAAEEPVVNLLVDMMNIESISGNEYEIGEYLHEYFNARGWTVERQEVEAGRSNVFAYAGERTCPVLLSSHIDTVPPQIPPTVTADGIHGRGATDAKSQVAAQIIAAEELIADGLLSPEDLCMLYVVGEEVWHDGMIKANESKIPFQYLLNGEPTESNLATGHKGFVLITLKKTGVAAHSGYPEHGDSAITPLLQVLQDLENEHWPSDDILGPTTLNIGTITAGTAANIVPDHAEAQVMIRVVTTAEDILAQVEKVVSGRASVELISWSDPEFCDVVDGFSTEAMAYGTDLPFIEGGKRYLYGAGTILVAHTDQEYISRDDLFSNVREYKRLAMAVLEQGKDLSSS